ncbi:MAG: hypothetical protein ABJ308_13240 [Halieaceae bacterium]
MALPDAPGSFTSRRIFKRILYPIVALSEALGIVLGKSQPRLSFVVEAEPPSTYLNFVIKSEALESFREYINIPADLPLSPMRCIDGEQEDYLLTLNIYRVSGIASGIRAEWSTYISDHQGIRRYMVLEARSSNPSVDAVELIVGGSRVEHDRQGDILSSVAESQSGELFSSDCDIAELDSAPYVAIAGEWLEANDYIYWRNGLCDRAFYEAGMANPKVRNLTGDAVSIDDQTHWAQFVEPRPKHTLIYETPLEFVLMPWRNLEK